MTNPKILEYINKQEPQKKAIIKKLRKILFNTLPEIKKEETMKYGVLCYKNLYYIAALPKGVNMGFTILGLSKEEIKQFQGTGKTMRHIKALTITFDKKPFIKAIKLIWKKGKPVH